MELCSAKNRIVEAIAAALPTLEMNGLRLKSAVGYLNDALEECDTSDVALLYIFGSIIVYPSDGDPEKGYCLEILCECKGGEVEESLMEEELTGFSEEANELRLQLMDSEDPAGFIKKYVEEKTEEANALMQNFENEMKMTQKVGFIACAVGGGILLVIAIIMLILG